MNAITTSGATRRFNPPLAHERGETLRWRYGSGGTGVSIRPSLMSEGKRNGFLAGRRELGFNPPLAHERGETIGGSFAGSISGFQSAPRS